MQSLRSATRIQPDRWTWLADLEMVFELASAGANTSGMDDADRPTVGAMHDGPAIKSRAVSDQFQQHCVRYNSQQFKATATDHDGHVVDEGMIHGGLYGPI
jgi:hypothetical protein